jgi:hypothetical protein
MRDLSELNINEGGSPVVRPAPTAAVIGAFQAHFGVVLPEGYLRLLRFANGGHPELDSIEPIGRPGAAPWAVDHFCFLDDDRTASESLWVAMATWRPELGRDAVPFAFDAFGNPFVLDLKSVPPAVKACVHDDGFAIVDIAPSFEAFIDALHIDPDMV